MNNSSRKRLNKPKLLKISRKVFKNMSGERLYSVKSSEKSAKK